jgi:Rod binding domain-containing protein
MTEESLLSDAILAESTVRQTGRPRGALSEPAHGQHEEMISAQQIDEPQERQQEVISQVYPDNDSAADVVGTDEDEYGLEGNVENHHVGLL